MTDPIDPNGTVANRLEERLHAAQSARDVETAQWNRVSNLRLIFAAGTAVAAFWWIRGAENVAGIVTGALAIAFAASLVWHRRIGARRRIRVAQVTVREQAIARIERDWQHLPEPGPAGIEVDHPYAQDLDLVGHGSLQQLIDTSQTPAGARTVADWLANGTETEKIRNRQVAARLIAGDEYWREQLAVAGLLVGRGSGDSEMLVAWLEDSRHWRLGMRHKAAMALAIGTLIAAALYAVGAGTFAWLAPFLAANALFTFVAPGKGELATINSHQRSLAQYRAVLPIAEAIPGDSTGATRLRNTFGTSAGPASHCLAALDRALAFVIPSGTIVWFPLQVALNWDVLVEARLYRLAASIGPQIREWIDAIGEVEAVAAIANLSALNPTWAWPDVGDEAKSFVAGSLGHPLIPDGRRVANDISVGPPGKVLIVTGSNMAGKSTLLRAIGLNMVLARAGGPVCAEKMTMPNLPVWSSVRIQDSLEQGVSLYMAELLRLKQIVDSARGGPIFYLLDEILHGTNTTERRIAARSVIRQLLGVGAIGAVSTHDLELVDEVLAEAAVCVHLVDQVVDGPNGPEMQFDYKLRPGLAPSSNALRLLELVGLGSGFET